jgi:hypothetical protein
MIIVIVNGLIGLYKENHCDIDFQFYELFTFFLVFLVWRRLRFLLIFLVRFIPIPHFFLFPPFAFHQQHQMPIAYAASATRGKGAIGTYALLVGGAKGAGSTFGSKDINLINSGSESLKFIFLLLYTMLLNLNDIIKK